MAQFDIDWNSSSRDYGMMKEVDNNVVIFYTKSVFDPVESKKQNIRVHKDMIYVQIFRPGEQMNKVDRPVEDSDKHRFAKQWHNFQHNLTQVPEGTPIDILFPNHPSVADSLRARGIYTIQQCAELTAHAIDSVGMGGQEYVNRAKKYIEAAGSGSSFLKFQEELKVKEQQIKLLSRDNNELKTQLDSVIQRLKALEGQQPYKTAPFQDQKFDPSHDVQNERIASNHVTKQIKK